MTLFHPLLRVLTPALGFEVDYTDMVFLRAGVGNFQNEIQIDNSEQVTFST